MSKITKPEKNNRDKWVPLRHASGITHLKNFFDTYTNLLFTITDQMKKRTIEMGKLGHELGKRHLDQKNGMQMTNMAKEATEKTKKLFNQKEVIIRNPQIDKIRKKDNV